MGIVKRYKQGKWAYGVSRRLPGNKLGMKRFRRWYENRMIAKHVLDRLNGAIATGTIDDVLPKLVGITDRQYTVKTFWDRFRDEYCKPRLVSWKRYRLSFDSINAKIGSVPLREFRRQHLHEFVEKRTRQVSKSTVNKDIAAIKKMFSFALEVGVIESHPLVKFSYIKTQEISLRLPTLEEFRILVDAMPDPAISALVAVLGETGMRKSEGLSLKWSDVDFRGKRIMVEKTKGKKVRSIPLSDFAIEKLRSLIRFVNQPYIFTHQGTGRRWKNPDKLFRKGRQTVKMEWITFHTLRHFRGTNWLQHGADIRTVKDTLGHKDIQTTMRYLKYIESHADKALREAQGKEKYEIQNAAERDKNGTIKK
jgi:integrase/recombinase XerD